MKVTTPRWIRGTLPRLQTLFQQKANSHGLFPILSPRQERMLVKSKLTPRPLDNKRAAILVPLVWHEDKPGVLFTKRSRHLKDHTSEISFPGGHQDGGESAIDTAIRETEEEIGGNWSSTIVIGQCTAVPSIRGTPVTSVLAVRPDPILLSVQETFLVNEQEVEEVFVISVQQLLDTESTEELGRISAPAPIFPTEFGTIWGLTAFVLRPILHQLLKPVYVDGLGLPGNDDDDDDHERTKVDGV